MIDVMLEGCSGDGIWADLLLWLHPLRKYSPTS